MNLSEIILGFLIFSLVSVFWLLITLVIIEARRRLYPASDGKDVNYYEITLSSFLVILMPIYPLWIYGKLMHGLAEASPLVAFGFGFIMAVLVVFMTINIGSGNFYALLIQGVFAAALGTQFLNSPVWNVYPIASVLLFAFAIETRIKIRQRMADWLIERYMRPIPIMPKPIASVSTAKFAGPIRSKKHKEGRRG